MIFRELVLQNFGQYGSRQTIALTPLQPTQPIILIGGQNGHGKTTLLDAIRLALYGHRAPCSNRGNLAYGDFLRQCLHRASPDQPATIELAFQQTLNSQPTEFRLCRTWRMGDKRDTLTVWRDGDPDAALTKGWDEFIEAVLPLGIANLFLFDGEQVKDLAEQDDLPPAVIGAMRSLLGLELPDRLTTDLDVLLRRKQKALATDTQRHHLDQLEQQLEQLEQQKKAANQALASIKPRLEQAENERDRAEALFLAEGGKIAAQQHQLEAQVQTLREAYAAEQHHLRELAAGVLPLSLIQPLLAAAEPQLQAALEQQQRAIAQAVLLAHHQRLLDFAQTLKLRPQQLRQLHAFLEAEQAAASPVNPASNPWPDSTAEILAHLRHTLHHTLPAARQQAQAHLQQARSHQADLDSTERYLLSAAAPEAYAKLQHAVRHAQAQVNQLAADYHQAQAHLDRVKQAIEQVRRDLVSYSEWAIARQNTDHLIHSIGRVQTILSEFKTRLKRRKLNQLETLVTECFLYLLHKPHLVNRIQIDADTFRLALFDAAGDPLPKHRLSAGEKQLLAIALLWGLARASRRPLPVAIDTPLGRLDAAHRQNLVERYFPQASHQVILLSTDTEIRQEEATALRQQGAIAREYLLHYDPATQQTTVQSKYFW